MPIRRYFFAMNTSNELEHVQLAIDIGSTIVKLARVAATGELLNQTFEARDFEAGIANQVEAIVAREQSAESIDGVRMCSSANGGLRVGVISLSDYFSGAILRNQVLASGGNPIFVESLDEAKGSLQSVDILLVGGGIDHPDAEPLARRLQAFDPGGYHYKTLAYAGNRFLADAFTARFADTIVIDNPLASGLRGDNDSVFRTLRRAYLDDLVYKEGVSELRLGSGQSIRPTPEVVNQGFRRAVLNQSGINVPGACVLIDIGGATTDLHYTVEIVRDESEDRPAAGESIARYVFTDLGTVFSRDSTLAQMRNHPRIYELLGLVVKGDVREVYRLLRESDYDPEPSVLAYGCLFLALDRFAGGRGPGLPSANLSKVSQFILTGGASQPLEETTVARVINLFVDESHQVPGVLIDRDYRLWVDGITWGDERDS